MHFGGKVVLFEGDFTEILPIVLDKHRSQIVWKWLKHHYYGIRLHHFNSQSICNCRHIQITSVFLPSIDEGGTGSHIEIPDSMLATRSSVTGLIHDKLVIDRRLVLSTDPVLSVS